MPELPFRIHFLADRGDARLRLDQVLVRRVTEISRLSRSRAQAFIEDGAVTVDGARARRPATRVREGAAIAITVPAAERRTRPEPEDLPLTVLYEDDHLLAIDKPPGLVAHPAYKRASGTILNRVLHRVRDRSLQPGIVTRLDKETSGVMLLALTPGMHARLQRQPPRKEYLAIVAARPAPRRGTISLPLGRDPADRRRVIVDDAGLPSTTHYEVLERHGNLTLVRCELETGRTHQVRVHLAAKGWPIAGDAAYGVADDRISRVALHAWRLQLRHPVSGAALTIESPLPADMAACLTRDAR